MADACGVVLRSQRNYESGERSPDASYLTAIDAAGADVTYILTGIRHDATLAQLSALPNDEARLLTYYRHSSETGKRALLDCGLEIARPYLPGLKP
jgi:transcriptional regulator with XRE-family HTH domain